MTNPTPPKPLSPVDRVLTDLLAASHAVEIARDDLDRQSNYRDALIVRASELGATRRKVADVAGVTPGRVQQILESADAGPRRKYFVTMTEDAEQAPAEPGDVAAQRVITTIVDTVDSESARAQALHAFKRAHGRFPVRFTVEIGEIDS